MFKPSTPSLVHPNGYHSDGRADARCCPLRGCPAGGDPPGLGNGRKVGRQTASIRRPTPTFLCLHSHLLSWRRRSQTRTPHRCNTCGSTWRWMLKLQMFGPKSKRSSRRDCQGIKFQEHSRQPVCARQIPRARLPPCSFFGPQQISLASFCSCSDPIGAEGS